MGVAFISHIYIDCNLNQHMQTSATTLHMHNRHKDLQDFSNERGGTTDMGFVFCCTGTVSQAWGLYSAAQTWGLYSACAGDVFCCTGTVSAAQALYLLHKHCVLHFERPFSVSETFGHKHFWVLGIAAYTYRTWGGGVLSQINLPPPPPLLPRLVDLLCWGPFWGVCCVLFCGPFERYISSLREIYL